MATKQAIKRPAKARTKQQPAPESIVNDAPRSFADADWPVGSAAHQGDVILVRIGELPEIRKPRANRQMADGTTQGSRHILEGGHAYDCEPKAIAAAIKAACPKSDLIDPKYLGPVFVTDSATALRHPEHGDHCYAEPEMFVAVVYQKNLDALQREQRTRD